MDNEFSNHEIMKVETKPSKTIRVTGWAAFWLGIGATVLGLMVLGFSAGVLLTLKFNAEDHERLIRIEDKQDNMDRDLLYTKSLASILDAQYSNGAASRILLDIRQELLDSLNADTGKGEK